MIIHLIIKTEHSFKLNVNSVTYLFLEFKNSDYGGSVVVV